MRSNRPSLSRFCLLALYIWAPTLMLPEYTLK